MSFVRFEWNEAKRQANLEKHGVDLLVGALIFEGSTVEAPTASPQTYKLQTYITDNLATEYAKVWVSQELSANFH